MSLLFRSRKKEEIDLVLSSCGTRAPCFIGGVEALLDKGYKIKRIGGSSGGALIAASYALGHTLRTMRERAEKVPYSDFKDFHLKNLLSLSNPSVYSGAALDKYLQELYGEATLSDFKIDCYIAVVTILGRKRKVLTKDSHPDLPVWKAVRMSCTIPFIFPYQLLDNVAVTDGGLITSVFDIFPDRPRDIVALRPRADDGLRKTVQDFAEERLFLWNYLKILAEYLLDAVDNQHVPDMEWNRTIIIPTFELGSFNFNLKPDQIQKLIQYGYNAVSVSEIVPDLS